MIRSKHSKIEYISNQRGRFALRKTLLFFMALLILVPLFGCKPAGATSTTGAITSATETETVSTAIFESEPARGESGTLRLWWSLHQDLNPLLDLSLSGQSAQTLIFQSLFERDTSWNLQPVLVKNYSFSADRLQLTIVLNSGVTFHNGGSLSASDVLACLDFIKQAGSLSPYAADLSAYSSGRLMSDTTLVLQLSAPDPDFLYALSFPVLPAGQLNLPAGSLIAGSGRYQMAEISPTGELNLTWAGNTGEKDASLQHIQLKPYASAIEAMRALEDDQLDLVFLAENDLSNYDVRSSLRLDRFIGRHYVYMAINDRLGTSTEPAQRYASLKYQLRSARWFAMAKPWSGQSADLPIPAFHACFNLHPLDFETLWPGLVDSQAITPATSPDQEPAGILSAKVNNRSLRIIAPADQPLLVKIAGQAKLWLAEAGQAAETENLAPDLYREALASQNYDLAVCESVIPPSAEPGWLLLGNSVATGSNVAISNSAASGSTVATNDADATGQQDKGLPVDHPNGYDGDQSDLAIGWPFFGLLGTVRVEDPEAAATLAAEYRKTLTDAAMRSPYIGIMLRESAVAYGDRVQGQCLPSLNQPYRGIEDLWIWSGLSS